MSNFNSEVLHDLIGELFLNLEMFYLLNFNFDYDFFFYNLGYKRNLWDNLAFQIQTRPFTVSYFCKLVSQYID